ncbi:MAG: PAS domain S-box protein [Candidatus Aureabacteria bacterium]|nr:PAS domain S-box protein [Candidatus Auribacterota bacterium]
MIEREESKKFIYLILFRLFLCFAILTVGAFVLKIHTSENLVVPFFLLVGILFVLNIPWIIILKKDLLSPSLQGNLQLYTDLVIEIAIIHYSGGLNSPFIYLPLISILSSAFLFSPKMIVIYSVSAAVLYVGVSILEFYQWLPSFLAGVDKLEINPISHFYYMIYVRIIIFLGIGYLSSVLNTRIRLQSDEIAKFKHLEDNILFQIKSGLITINNNETIIYANKAASDILGYSIDELIGRDWYFIFFGNKYNVNLEIIKQAKSLRGVELKIETKSGHPKIIGFNLSDLKNEQAEAIGKTMVFRDITNIKNMEEKLKIKNKLEAIGELAAIMAHELKNPLTSICGSIEVLKESGTFSKPRDQELINVIFKESERLSRTLGEFLTFTGETYVKKEKKEILKILDEVIQLVKNSRDFKPNIIIEKQYDPKDFSFAFLDEKQIRQVFFNLVLNAVQAMPEGGTLTLKADPYLRGDLNFMKIGIKDTGKGIDPALKEKIFEPFFTSKEKGIGLGLTVVKKIIEKHGWEIDLVSSPGLGCEVIIHLPLTR